MKISAWQWASLVDKIDHPLVNQSDIIPDVPVKVKVNRSDIIPDVPLPFPPYIIVVLKAGADVPAGWHVCDGTTGTPDLSAETLDYIMKL